MSVAAVIALPCVLMALVFFLHRQYRLNSTSTATLVSTHILKLQQGVARQSKSMPFAGQPHPLLNQVQTSVQGHSKNTAPRERSRGRTATAPKSYFPASGHDDLEAEGDFLDHEYHFARGGRIVATVSKQWFSWSDTYGVEIADGEDDALLLASTVVIDMVCHGDRQEQGN